tara:strand:- start:1663 stop:1887 length:225 start_codon:yes stop_codon:yes gene_type:complete
MPQIITNLLCIKGTIAIDIHNTMSHRNFLHRVAIFSFYPLKRKYAINRNEETKEEIIKVYKKEWFHERGFDIYL